MNLARERSLYKAFSEQALKARQADLGQIQEQIGTGRRINRASDDAAGYAQARQLELLGDRYGQYNRSILSARSWTDHTQAGLDRLAELFTQVQELGVRFANDTLSADDRQTGQRELEGVLASIVEQLNAKAGDEHLFAGSRTTYPQPAYPAGTKPFTLGPGNVVTYNGNDEARERQIGRDLTLAVNITGQDLLDTGAGFTITEAVAGLITAVGTGDAAQLDAALAQVQTARNHVIDRSGEAGNIANRLQMAEHQLAEATLLVEGRRSQIEDIDLADAMMRYQQAQTGLQAALRVAAEVVQTSLLDYLR